ncbi:MAG: putative membrane protein YfcA [Porticoccus sp.]|jgi:uncharacterized membrane protein YfcA
MMALLVLFVGGVIAWFVSTVAAGGAAMLMIPVLSLMLGPQVVARLLA